MYPCYKASPPCAKQDTLSGPTRSKDNILTSDLPLRRVRIRPFIWYEYHLILHSSPDLLGEFDVAVFSMASTSSFAPPKLADFILTERLGSGTYATVYKAYRKVSFWLGQGNITYKSKTFMFVFEFKVLSSDFPWTLLSLTYWITIILKLTLSIFAVTLVF